MKATFKDPTLQEQFSRDGFVVVPFLNSEQVLSLNQQYDQLPARSSQGFFSGIYTSDRGFKTGSSDILKDTANSFADRYLDDYRMLTGNFVLKHPDDTSAMPCHQDWTFVDEKRYASINLWCALTNTSFGNGALHLVPGSHRLTMNIRGTNVPDSLGGVGPISFSRMTCVEIEAGHAIVHDHRVLHSSPPNLSGRRRLATAICMIPAEANPLHYFVNPTTEDLEAYAIDSSFFFDYTYGDMVIPDSAHLIGRTPRFQQHQFSPDELEKLLQGTSRNQDSH